MMGPEEKIQILRQEIERLDDRLVNLLDERARVALEVGKVKKENQIPFYNPRREREVVLRAREKSSGPFPAEALTVVFREVISGCRSLEAEMTVVYLGPAATYTHLACI
jgi:chorismate mutase / prephenate dehydratase